MKRKLILVIVSLFFSAFVLADGFRPYEWEKERTRVKLSAKENEMSELILKNHVEYNYGFENDQFLLQTVVHRIILVNNSEAIQKHNQIVIPMKNAIELVDLKARSINKEGKVVLFDRNNLKEMKDEESNNAYRIFAIEGIELGSEVEYYYVRKIYPNYFDKALMQLDAPIKSSSFTLRCPKHLKYDFKTYQGFPAIKTETNEEQNIYTSDMADVPAMKKENFAFFDSNRKRIEFKLAYNTARSQARLYTWDDAAKRFFTILNDTEHEKENEKALTKYIKTFNDNPAMPMAARIRSVEDKIKSTIAVNQESNDESISNIASILKLNVASKEGMAKLFFLVYTKLNIPCHIVLTCSRENSKFDGGFDTWDYLDDYFLFFPETHGFMAPYEQATRYPLIPSENTAQEGLFIEPIVIGGVKSGIGTIQKIPAVDYTLSADNLEVNVEFDEEITTNKIKIKRTFSGYNALFVTPYYPLMTKEQLQAMVEEITKQTAPDPTIRKWTAEPVLDSDINKFLVDVDFQSTHFLEKAGPNVLFKIGELIGPQSELYKDNERMNDVENDYNRGYDRLMQIHLPAGYVIRNAGDLKFDVVYQEGNDQPFLFHSDYEIKGSVLTVKIREYYKQIFAPLARYEDYRKVINAAADFNKVTLVLEKTK